MSSYDEAARDLETQQQQAKGEESFLSFEERKQLQRMLSFPEEFPKKFGTWIQDYIALNGLAIPYSQIVGLDRFAFGKGAELPTTPSNGQLFSLSLGSGVVWNFRYNDQSSSSYKWEFVGGPPLNASVSTSQSTASSSYTDLSTVGPEVTVPFAGEYLVSVGCRIRVSSSAVKAYMSYDGPGVSASDSWACGADLDSLGGLLGLTVFATFLSTFTGSGDVTAKYRIPDSTSRAISDRNITVLPIRVSS